VNFELGKPEALADLMLQYLDDDEWLEEMGENAHDRSFHFGWGRTAKRNVLCFFRYM